MSQWQNGKGFDADFNLHVLLFHDSPFYLQYLQFWNWQKVFIWLKFSLCSYWRLTVLYVTLWCFQMFSWHYFTLWVVIFVLILQTGDSWSTATIQEKNKTKQNKKTRKQYLGLWLKVLFINYREYRGMWALFEDFPGNGSYILCSHYCSRLLAIAVISTMTKSNLGMEGFISTYIYR